MQSDRRYLPLARPGRLPLLSVLRHAMAAWRQRRHLETLDSDALKDLGLSHSDVAKEAARPIWDVPEQWRCR